MHCEHGLFFYNCTPRLSYKIFHGSTENDSSLLLPFRPPLFFFHFNTDPTTSARGIFQQQQGCLGFFCKEIVVTLMNVATYDRFLQWRKTARKNASVITLHYITTITPGSLWKLSPCTLGGGKGQRMQVWEFVTFSCLKLICILFEVVRHNALGVRSRSNGTARGV